MKTRRSKQYFQKACQVIPGGVNSPVRAFNAVGGSPLFIEKGRGAYIYDVDGNRFIDYVLSWGPLILGHAAPPVLAELRRVMANGTSFGAATRAEVLFAAELVKAFPSMDQVRLVNSGTEATMSALRLARAYTRRDGIIKFEGCYHGHADSLLVKAGSGAATFGIPTSLGIPRDLAKQTMVLPYNDMEAATAAIRKHHQRIAAVIIEPVCGNMGVVKPQPGFLRQLRLLTRRYGIVLIFDEVMTGFRSCYGGAQHMFRVKPDITCLGKVIGGGLPIGAYGASRRMMRCVAPEGGMYQAGTQSGNPLAVACGLKTLHILRGLDYNTINERCASLCAGLAEAAGREGIPAVINRWGSMYTLFFTADPVRDYQSALRSNTRRYAAFFQQMLSEGIYVAPSQFEAAFLSFAHAATTAQRTVKAARNAFKGLQEIR